MLLRYTNYNTTQSHNVAAIHYITLNAQYWLVQGTDQSLIEDSGQGRTNLICKRKLGT